MKQMNVFLRACLLALSLSSSAALLAETVEKWGLYEIELDGPSDGNPFLDVELEATFTNGYTSKTVSGFYDGEGIYRIRFMPEAVGEWRYTTQSNDWSLTKQSGTFTVTEPSEDNHGPVGVYETYHFAYADGTPYKQFGTTIYNWIDAPESLQEETLRTLAESPFNKARMLLTQQPTPYRNEYAPPRWPYVGTPPHDWDFTRFNPEFFRHYEKRIEQLRDLGIEADIILFNPYGKFGFESLDAEGDERFVRYVVARFGAYRNVWWSLANEYDFLKTKTEADWERIGRLVMQCDPFNHLRSIHNGHLLFDHRQDWVTHVSVQDGHACESPASAKIYRDAFRKPVVFDEIKYEGDAKFRWADLDGKGMTHRFWAAMMAGTYVGHGDYFNTLDEDTWTSFGGKILGDSVPRIAFLREIVEDGPKAGLNLIDSWMNPGMTGVAGEYYLQYFGRETPVEWEFKLYKGIEAGTRFKVEIIDAWNMSITPVKGIFEIGEKDGYYHYDTKGRKITLSGKPYQALRITRVD
ncbi:DUF5060 domain-containing protein [Pelagicoccus enzymogenes]|uniref:DUF5060 domain-containing protein n=1 Tax=Pelagicoccus enzymogenes TaxID=2773457 RepID=UPI002810901A|nr:DUF5060 domain-containing protein [Pelagicoccus enzymogenes]MDQ8197705.1 DUF5060 domain-containing protein [Pelagicoccus enzymogenes]